MQRSIEEGGIHPVRYKVVIVATDGTEFECTSTKNSGYMRATFDKHNHSAWNKGAIRHVKTGRVALFNTKYKQQEALNLGSLFGVAAKSEAEEQVVQDDHGSAGVAGKNESPKKKSKK